MVKQLSVFTFLALLLALPSACGKFAEGEPVVPAGGGGAQDVIEEKITDFDFSMAFFYDWSDSTCRVALTLEEGGSGTYRFKYQFNREATPFSFYAEDSTRIPNRKTLVLEKGKTRLLSTDVDNDEYGYYSGGTKYTGSNRFAEITLSRGSYIHSHTASLFHINHFVVGDVDTASEYTRFSVKRPIDGSVVYYQSFDPYVEILLDGKPIEGLKTVIGGTVSETAPEFYFGERTYKWNFELPRIAPGRHAIMVEFWGTGKDSFRKEVPDYPYSEAMVGYTFIEPDRDGKDDSEKIKN